MFASIKEKTIIIQQTRLKYVSIDRMHLIKCESDELTPKKISKNAFGLKVKFDQSRFYQNFPLFNASVNVSAKFQVTIFVSMSLVLKLECQMFAPFTFSCGHKINWLLDAFVT